MRPDTTLVLGDFQFGAMEVPAEIPFGGSQRMNVHELVGGTRVVDAMGRSDRPLAWSGLLLGSSALDRARALDALRAGGQQQVLTWSAFSYLVVVREFQATFQRAYQIPYTISCEVVADQTSPLNSSGVLPVDQAISDDSTAATTLAGAVGDSTLSGLMTTLNSAISAVSSFATAAQSTINSVLAPLAAVQARVQVLITSVGNTVRNVSTFGGVLPNTPVAQAAAALTGQVTSMTQLTTLVQLRNVLGRMGSNLGAINSSSNTVAVAGGNLFQVAEQQYGDATAWTAIAKANGLTDPFIQGTKVLTIPKQSDQQQGVLVA